MLFWLSTTAFATEPEPIALSLTQPPDFHAALGMSPTLAYTPGYRTRSLLETLGPDELLVQLEQVDETVRRGRVGVWLSGIGSGVSIVGAVVVFASLDVFGGGADVNDAQLLAGAGLLVAGGVVSLVGPPITAANGVKGARLLGTEPTLGYVAWATYAASIIVPGGYWASVVTGGMQIRQNRLESEYLRAQVLSDLRITPTINGVALSGRF